MILNDSLVYPLTSHLSCLKSKYSSYCKHSQNTQTKATHNQNLSMRALLLLGLFILTLSCNSNNSKKEQPVAPVTKTPERYPAHFSKVLDAHGTLADWDAFKTLSFTLVPEQGTEEIHTIDLHSRKDRLAIGTATLGYDGEEVWVKDPDSIYKGNADFYHNLMFYFYAMPFVLADEGIIYEKTEALQVADTAYPGIKMQFEANIGASSNDEYYLYYDPNTHQMRWLGYTATFGAAKKSDRVNYIAYHDWQEVEGIVLPHAISWYTVENGIPTQPRSTVRFEQVSLSTASKPKGFYAK